MNDFNNHSRSVAFRGSLLATVSSLALFSYACLAPGDALAAGDESKPLLWIELGAQLERTDHQQDILTPDFFNLASQADRSLMMSAQRPPRYSFGGEGKISFRPEDSSWIFSAGIRYGRSNSERHRHHETAGLPVEYDTAFGNLLFQYTPRIRQYGDAQTSAQENHLIIDFSAGRDVGLGLFGSQGHSTINAGVRFAQFTSTSNATLHNRPVNLATGESFYYGLAYIYFHHQRTYSAAFQAERNTHAIGPAISWDASAAIAGTDNGAELSVDWGVNAALLFGRKRSKTHHQTAGQYWVGPLGAFHYEISTYSHNEPTHVRSRTATIPNVGGFAGFSLRFPNAKVSIGYRGDFFFHATDSGIDTARNADQNFYGPFASISIGLGD